MKSIASANINTTQIIAAIEAFDGLNQSGLIASAIEVSPRKIAVLIIYLIFRL